MLAELKQPGYIAMSARSASEICSGEKLKDTLKELCYSEYLVAVGINCSGLKYINELTQIIKEFFDENQETLFKDSNRPEIVVYPNSGEIYDGVNKVWLPDEECCGKSFEELALGWYKNGGVRCIGGCCRVLPEDIKTLADKIKAGQ